MCGVNSTRFSSFAKCLCWQLIDIGRKVRCYDKARLSLAIVGLTYTQPSFSDDVKRRDGLIRRFSPPRNINKSPVVVVTISNSPACHVRLPRFGYRSRSVSTPLWRPLCKAPFAVGAGGDTDRKVIDLAALTSCPFVLTRAGSS